MVISRSPQQRCGPTLEMGKLTKNIGLIEAEEHEQWMSSGTKGMLDNFGILEYDPITYYRE